MYFMINIYFGSRLPGLDNQNRCQGILTESGLKPCFVSLPQSVTTQSFLQSVFFLPSGVLSVENQQQDESATTAVAIGIL